MCLFCNIQFLLNKDLLSIWSVFKSGRCKRKVQEIHSLGFIALLASLPFPQNWGTEQFEGSTQIACW